MTRDVPGIDAAFLAIDTDDAVEFVWNEVRYSNRKVVKESKVRWCVKFFLRCVSFCVLIIKKGYRLSSNYSTAMIFQWRINRTRKTYNSSLALIKSGA